MILTGRTAVAAVLVAVGVFVATPNGSTNGWVVLLVANVVLLAMAALDAVAAPSPSSINMRREHPGVVVLERTATLRWVVQNTSRRRMRLGIADDLPDTLGVPNRRCAVVIAPGGTATVTTTMTPVRRGRFALDTASVRLRGPLGLAARQARIKVPSQLRVHPPFRSQKEAELKIRQARLLTVGLRSARGLGGGTEFEQLREYTTDDEFRSVDWAATARAGKTIVRTYRPERNQTIIVMLDAGRLMAGRVDGVPRLEHAMDAVMMLGAVATSLGDKVGLVVFDAAVQSTVAPARHRDQVSRMTEAMFDVEPALAATNYRAAFAEMLARFRRRSLVVVLTELASHVTEESLAPALPLLGRNHVVVVASVTDPAVASWSTEPVQDDVGAYRRAAALSSLSQRRRAGGLLRGRGAIVLDAPPGRLASELADVYLQVKSTGRL